MYKLSEKEFLEKKNKYKGTFIYFHNKKQIIINLIILAISMYILFTGIIAFTNLMFYANGKISIKNKEILEILVTITSLFLTVGLTGTFFFGANVIALGKNDNKTFKEFVTKK